MMSGRYLASLYYHPLTSHLDERCRHPVDHISDNLYLTASSLTDSAFLVTCSPATLALPEGHELRHSSDLRLSKTLWCPSEAESSSLPPMPRTCMRGTRTPTAPASKTSCPSRSGRSHSATRPSCQPCMRSTPSFDNSLVYRRQLYRLHGVLKLLHRLSPTDFASLSEARPGTATWLKG